MTDHRVPIQIGKILIADLHWPQPEELDLDFIEDRLKTTRRFGNDPKALTIRQHSHLVVRLIELSKKQDFHDTFEGHDLWLKCCEWGYRHDDHEGVIGDIRAPVKKAVSQQTSVLDHIEAQLDKAICSRYGIPTPSEQVKGTVHRYDKAAETLEWLHALNKPLAGWNAPVPEHLMATGKNLIWWARGQG